MAENGDQNPDDDHEVGFFSPQALAGRTREPEPAPEPEPEPEPDPEPEPEPEPDLFDAPEPEPEDRPEAESEPVAPAWRERVRQADDAVAGDDRFGRRKASGVAGGTGLYATYALILLAVPTLGVSALLGLLSVLGREGPSDPVARSHFIYQQRTLYIAACVALLGAVLIIVGLGVFVLFVLALWMMVRGAAGVMRLKADKAISDPRKWLI